MPSPIYLDNVTKTYGKGEDALHVIDQVSTRIEGGEFVSIVGPSGCGKTTLIKIVAGLVSATSGTVRTGDSVVTEPTGDSAMVFQSFGLYPWRTVLDNVALGLEIEGVGKEERYERARDWIERVKLDGFEDSYPAKLSGGMKQRVGLARALAVDPEILLMDEPFGALDALTKYEMQTELLKLLEEQQKTIIFVTHDIQESIFLSDRVFVMGPKPANFVLDLEIDLDRPRWDRRTEIENSPSFAEYETKLQEKLGLSPEEIVEAQ